MIRKLRASLLLAFLVGPHVHRASVVLDDAYVSRLTG